MTASADPAPDDRRWWALAVVATAQLMVALDLTIMLIALPSAQADLGMSSGQGRWVLTGYALALGALLILGGRIGDLLGRRTTLIIATLGFAAASALGGSAGEPGLLLAARALQGVAAALLAPATLSLLPMMFPDPVERGRAFGIYAATLQGGIAIGLLLGGALTEWLSWRWCMYINVPIAIAVALGAGLVVPAGRAARSIGLDLPGAVLAGAGLGALVFGVSEAETDGWGSALVIGLLVVAVLALVAFLRWEGRARAALLPPRLLRSRELLGANGAFLISSLGTNGAFLLLTYQAQSVLGYSALRTGVGFLPLILVIAVVATRVTPRLMPRFSPRTLMATGLAVIGLGLLAMTRLSVDGGYVSQLLVPLLLLGLGMGLSVGPIMHTATHVERPQDVSAASSLIRAAQQVGAALGTAVITTIAANYTTGDSLAERVHGYAAASAWSAGILAVTALGLVVLMRMREVGKPAEEPVAAGL